MSSGVTVADECVEVHERIKMKKDLRYVTFKMSDDKKTIVVDETGDATKTYADFVKALPEGSPRYALVDFEFTTDDGRPQNKLVFVFWSPDDKTTVKERMLYASSKDAVRKKCTGVMKEAQVNDIGDLAEAEMLSKVK
ncbi:unnamed protein product [Effrenium voratum]|uniref:ADF-H domain-containing protein n=1 Tax=Effrenium voratum TaxID=2562239 RepID=A0AA36I8F4_9DINO|nr:unnamed protein product [Effrenium voratum]CAJ1382643.1 unnamed protein product [Effrenium voratum]CAJ1434344.1 unnamed protein product [Effrenium voratum]CAJ1434345.1 unnamed protein product [Effrenium voratum]